MPGLGLGQGSGLGDSSSDTSPLELDEYLETEAGEAAEGLGMRQRGVWGWLWPTPSFSPSLSPVLVGTPGLHAVVMSNAAGFQQQQETESTLSVSLPLNTWLLKRILF